VLFLIGCDYLRQMKLAHHHFDNKVFMGPLRIVELLCVATLVSRWMPRDAKFLHGGIAGRVTELGTRSLEIFARTLVSCHGFTHLAAMLNVGRAGCGGLLAAKSSSSCWWGAGSSVC
jgi:hypothetical protein